MINDLDYPSPLVQLRRRGPWAALVARLVEPVHHGKGGDPVEGGHRSWA
jgi:hypothetical protein